MSQTEEGIKKQISKYEAYIKALEKCYSTHEYIEEQVEKIKEDILKIYHFNEVNDDDSIYHIFHKENIEKLLSLGDVDYMPQDLKELLLEDIENYKSWIEVLKNEL